MKKNVLIIGSLVLVAILASGYYFLNKPFLPTQEELSSRKTVEDFFMEHMNVSAEEAKNPSKLSKTD